jgi:hypothetical protein
MAARGIGALLSILCCDTFAQAGPAAALRPQSARLQQVIEWANQESATFRTLADTLSAHEVMVWMTAGTCDQGRHPACLQHRITISGVHRFLFVSISDDLPPLRIAGLVAHELQHAVEVARAGITTADGFEALYQRIGEPCDNQHVQECRETTAAREVETRVLAELAASGRATVGR